MKGTYIAVAQRKFWETTCVVRNDVVLLVFGFDIKGTVLKPKTRHPRKMIYLN